MSELLSSSLLLFLLIPGPSPFVSATPPTPSATATLTVAAASDLSTVAPELQHRFESQNPNIRIRFVNGSSAMLAQQIANGAPFDVFLSANEAFVDQLARSSRILPATTRVYAVGRLGVLWRDGKPHPLRDLTTSQVRVLALPNPELAPYGVAAQQALEYAGLWSMVQRKVVYGENVRQALQFLDSGNADAVITSAALLQGRHADLIPAEWHKPIRQKGGIVSGTKQPELAHRFLDFLTGRDGQSILARFAFGAPE